MGAGNVLAAPLNANSVTLSAETTTSPSQRTQGRLNTATRRGTAFATAKSDIRDSLSVGERESSPSTPEPVPESETAQPLPQEV